MSIKTEYDIWCLDNCIGDGDLFLSNLKNAGKKDKRFMELYDMLINMDDKYMDIEPGIKDINYFESRLVELYGYKFRILDEHLLLLMSLDNRLEDTENAINVAFSVYNLNYRIFIDKINSWDNKNIRDNIISIVQRFKINRAKEEASKLVYNMPTQEEINDLFGLVNTEGGASNALFNE